MTAISTLCQTHGVFKAPRSLVFEKISKNWFSPDETLKISFLRFPQKVSILKYMLLHNSYINMAIPHMFHHQKSLLDHQGAVNMNSDSKKISIRPYLGVANCAGYPLWVQSIGFSMLPQQLDLMSVWSGWRSQAQVKSREPSVIPFWNIYILQ